MKILVTGAAGFIGKHLCASLKNRGFEVLGTDIRSDASAVSFQTCDLLDRNALVMMTKSFMPEAVVHLGARTDLAEKKNLRGYAANTEGTRNLIHAIDGTGSVQRVLFVSTQLVNRVGAASQSSTDYSPDTLYGESKAEMERIIREKCTDRFCWCILRPTTVWGPGMSVHYQRFLRLIAQGRYFHVGRKDLRKSYGYVGNVVHQIERFLGASSEKIHGNVFYLTDYEPLSLRQWADEIRRQLDAPPIPSIPFPVARMAAAAGDILNALGYKSFPFNSFRLRNVLTEYQVDPSFTREICGPLPYSVEQGVRQLVEWFVERNSRNN